MAARQASDSAKGFLLGRMPLFRLTRLRRPASVTFGAHRLDKRLASKSGRRPQGTSGGYAWGVQRCSKEEHR